MSMDKKYSPFTPYDKQLSSRIIWASCDRGVLSVKFSDKEPSQTHILKALFDNNQRWQRCGEWCHKDVDLTRVGLTRDELRDGLNKLRRQLVIRSEVSVKRLQGNWVEVDMPKEMLHDARAYARRLLKQAGPEQGR